ncbi:LysM domain-containing protein [Mycetocola sp. 2940]|uniref:LysM peptidoglycan-binding domain-containing protein n=1 Tax=Mycetocola sp. 2940 TaxID=3156452 RepID=UPI003396D86F
MALTARRHRRGWTAVVALSMVLSGCTLTGTTAASTPTPSATPTASATPTPTVEAPELAEGTVVATGALAGDDRVSGEAEVRVTEVGTFELHLIDFRADHSGEISVGWSPRVVEPGTPCTSSIMTLDYGNISEHPSLVFPVMSDFTRGDPSFLRTVLITLYDEVAFAKGCYISVLSSAVLTWTLPDMRPGLVVEDSGRTGGASGIVTIVDGEPRNYTVAPNDLIAEVTARLGITIDDLFYLNPTTIAGSHMLQAGDVLNLSKAHR